MKHFLNTDVEITIEEVMPRSPSPPLEEKLTTIVHRVKVLEELIEMFKNPQIIKKSIQFSFINEAGADQSGVSSQGQQKEKTSVCLLLIPSGKWRNGNLL